jgi:hypothetical protein
MKSAPSYVHTRPFVLERATGNLHKMGLRERITDAQQRTNEWYFFFFALLHHGRVPTLKEFRPYASKAFFST